MRLVPGDLRVPTSARLLFRVWREEDVELAVALWGDARVTRYLNAAGVFARSDVEARVAREIAHHREHGVGYWIVTRRDGGAFVGCCGLKPYDLAREILELGFHLRPEHWGAGLATEAARAVITFAFATLEAEALFAGHHPDNEASKRALERVGFRYSHHELFPPTGLQHPGYLLARSSAGPMSPLMTTQELRIEGMSCQHCVKSVREALLRVPGVTRADVEVGHAKVEGEVSKTALVAALAAIDYPAS